MWHAETMELFENVGQIAILKKMLRGTHNATMERVKATEKWYAKDKAWIV